MESEGDLQLFKAFPGITTREWEERIKQDLNGVLLPEDLVWATEEGIPVNPFYRQEDLKNLDYLQQVASLKKKGSAPNGWVICQEISLERDLQEVNSRIRAASGAGAGAIRIRFRDPRLPALKEMEEMLAGFSPESTALLFHGCHFEDRLYGNLVTLAGSSGWDPGRMKGSLGADPLGTMARHGSPPEDMDRVAHLVKKVRQASPDLKALQVDGALFQNAGSTLVEELAFGLSMASEYMSLLTDRGIDPPDAEVALLLHLASGPSFFMEIAKLRACRLLWARISEAYGIRSTENGITIHSSTSEWNLSLYDPHTNLLRSTTQAMASILGGADLVGVLPFDHPLGTGNAFSDRLARNIQLLLREEAGFDRVADPAGGAYYIESLTDAMAERAWDLFLEVEEKGGFSPAFKSGWIRERIAASRKRKEILYASGKRKIIGTSAYPDLDETILGKLGDRGNDRPTGQAPDKMFPIQEFRISAMFETVRLQTEASRKRPRVLLCKYGDPAWVNARATFAKNFMGCGGYEIVDPPAFSNLEEGIREIKASRPDVIIFCGPDEAYADFVPGVARTFRGKLLLVVAGHPEGSMELLQNEGVTHFINTDSNLLECLKEFNGLLLNNDTA